MPDQAFSFLMQADGILKVPGLAGIRLPHATIKLQGSFTCVQSCHQNAKQSGHLINSFGTTVPQLLRQILKESFAHPASDSPHHTCDPLARLSWDFLSAWSLV